MNMTVTLENVQEQTDIDGLWTAFLDAKSSSDDVLADAIRQRMAELQRVQQLDSLDDAQLRAKISNLRAASEAPAHTNVGDSSEVSSLGDDQTGPSTELAQLCEEAERRGLKV